MVGPLFSLKGVPVRGRGCCKGGGSPKLEDEIEDVEFVEGFAEDNIVWWLAKGIPKQPHTQFF